MRPRRIGDIVRGLFGNLPSVPGSPALYEWTFAGYGRCGGCEKSIEWWRSSKGSKVALEPDTRTFWTKGDTLRVDRHQIEALVRRRAHWLQCPDAQLWRGRKRHLANREDEALRRYEQRLRDDPEDKRENDKTK